MGDAHVYKDHVEPLREQLKREPREFPTLKFARAKEEIGGIDGFRLEDFVVEGYKPMGKIEMKMSVSGLWPSDTEASAIEPQLSSGDSELIPRLETYLQTAINIRHTFHPMRFLQLDRHVQHSHDLSMSFSEPWAEYAAS